MAHKQLSEEVAAYVRGLIVSGQLKPEEFVRVERVADELTVSPTPVREGLLLLRGEGFLRLEPRRGFIVAALTEGDVLDVFWVQAQLAGELAARAAKTLTDDQVEELQEMQERLNAALERSDLPEVERINHDFHRAINLSAGAPKLEWFLRTANRYVPDRFYQQIYGWPDATVHDHVAILTALAAHDTEAARAAMTFHITHAGELLGKHRALPADAAATGRSKKNS